MLAQDHFSALLLLSSGLNEYVQMSAVETPGASGKYLGNLRSKIPLARHFVIHNVT
jgi:hypothetical protein